MQGSLLHSRDDNERLDGLGKPLLVQPRLNHCGKCRVHLTDLRSTALHQSGGFLKLPVQTGSSMTVCEGLQDPPARLIHDGKGRALASADVTLSPSRRTLNRCEATDGRRRTVSVRRVELTAEEQWHYGPDGPVHAARAWAVAVGDTETFREAWVERTAPSLRELIVNAFVNANAGLADEPDLAGALINGDATHQLWAPFVQTQAAGIRKLLADVIEDRAGGLGRPRPIGPDLELVVFLDAGGRTTVGDREEEFTTTTFLLERADGRWLVAAVNDPRFPPDSDG